jgi:hypothetical protein
MSRAAGNRSVKQGAARGFHGRYRGHQHVPHRRQQDRSTGLRGGRARRARRSSAAARCLRRRSAFSGLEPNQLHRKNTEGQEQAFLISSPSNLLFVQWTRCCRRRRDADRARRSETPSPRRARRARARRRGARRSRSRQHRDGPWRSGRAFAAKYTARV